MRKSYRNFSANILLLAVSIMMSAFLFEILGRIYFFGWTVLWPPNHTSIPYIGSPDIWQQSSIPEIQMREIRPNVHTRFKKARFDTDAHGIRDKHYDMHKPPDTFRIVVLGDSHTMPAGVAIEDAYHSLLEEELNQEGDRHIELINFGVGGYSISDYRYVLEKKASAYDPDMILLGIVYNDFQEYEKTSLPKNPPPSLLLYAFQKLFSPESVTHLQKISWSVTDLQRLNGTYPPTDVFVPKKAYMKEHFDVIARYAKQKHIPLVVVLLDYLQLHPDWVEFWRENAEKQNAYFVDTTPAFIGKNPYDFMIYKSDKHPNAKANRIFADVLRDFLRSSQLIPTDQER